MGWGMSNKSIVDEFILRVLGKNDRLPMTKEQCLAQQVSEPSYVVKVDGFRAVVSPYGFIKSIVISKKAIESSLESLQEFPVSSLNKKGKSNGSIKEIKGIRFQGFAFVEDEVCFLKFEKKVYEPTLKDEKDD